MQVTLVLHAMDIPDNTPVRKLTGEVVYTLKKEIKVYADLIPQQRQVLKGDDVVFLMGGSSINAYPATTKFAVDLPIDEAIDLLGDLASQ